jgi:hypothetical protein
MADYNPTTYGERIASLYDELYSDYDPAAIELLADSPRAARHWSLLSGQGGSPSPFRQKG